MSTAQLLSLSGPVLSCFVFLQLLPPCRSVLPLSVLTAVSFSLALPLFGLPQGFGSIVLQAAHFALIAVPIAFALESLRVAARLIDSARGAQFAEQAIPQVGQSSLLEHAAVYLSACWLLLSDLETALEVLYWPMRRPLAWEASLLESLLLLSQAFYTGVLLAAPLFALALILDVNGLLLAKLLPRFPLSFELLPWKLLLLLFALIIRLQVVPEALLRLRIETLQLLLGASNG